MWHPATVALSASGVKAFAWRYRHGGRRGTTRGMQGLLCVVARNEGSVVEHWVQFHHKCSISEPHRECDSLRTRVKNAGTHIFLAFEKAASGAGLASLP